MTNIIDSIAKTLLYKGPILQEIILDAMDRGCSIDIVNDNSNTNVIIKSIIVYNVEVIDMYTYDNEQNLIKHIIKVNNKEKIVFDKYEDARFMISELKDFEQIAS